MSIAKYQLERTAANWMTGERFLKGQKVWVSCKKDSISDKGVRGTISKITAGGIHIDVGKKKDKYIRYADILRMEKIYE